MNFNIECVRRAQRHQTDYTLNSIVTWTSHSPRGVTTKTGVIVAIVNPLTEVSLSFKDWHKYECHTDYGTPRAVRSYLVSVEGNGSKNKPKLYWPRPNMLKEIK